MIISFSIILFLVSCATEKDKIQLDIISDINVYNQSVIDKPHNELIDLVTVVPHIKLDIRYATKNNFTGEIVYKQAKAYARKLVAESLAEVANELFKDSIGLVVYDAYRPYAATVKFFEILPDPNYCADPKFGSRHNRGCAIDVTLYDLRTEKYFEMPTEYDDFTEKASPEYSDLPKIIKENRSKLISIMKQFGFTVYPTEWWHYDFAGWENYKLMDISFEALSK